MITLKNKPFTLRVIARTLIVSSCLGVVACAHNDDGAPTAKTVQTRTPKETIASRADIVATQRGLKALGYEPGATDGVLGPKTVDAIRAYQADRQLPVDGRASVALVRKLNATREKLPSETAADYQFGETYVYSDRSSAQVQGLADRIRLKTSEGAHREVLANYLLVSGDGIRTDAPQDFLQPLKPGAQGEYKLYRKSPDGLDDSVSVVTCAVGQLKPVTVPAGTFDTLEARCREIGGGRPPVDRAWSYAPSLRHVIRQTTTGEGGETQTRELVAIRPATDAWPSAARAGLDWATVSALEEGPQSSPVEWSSTGVPRRYTIDVIGALATPAFASDVTGCLRYEIVQADAKGAEKTYPGVACKSAQGKWIIPGRPSYLFATAPSGLNSEAHACAGAPAGC